MRAEQCVPYTHAGEEPVTGIVSGVTQSASSTIVSCVEDERLEFQVLCSGFEASRIQEHAQALHRSLCGSSVWHSSNLLWRSSNLLWHNKHIARDSIFHSNEQPAAAPPRSLPHCSADAHHSLPLCVARSRCFRVSVPQPCSWVQTMRRRSCASQRAVATLNPKASTRVDPEHGPACTLQDGQLVTFTEVEGIPQLNDGKPRRVKNVKVAPFPTDT